MTIFVEQTLRVSDCRDCRVCSILKNRTRKSRRESIIWYTQARRIPLLQNQTFVQNRLMFSNNNRQFGGGFDVYFVNISQKLTHRVRIRIFSKCRKIAIPLYAEARQFHLVQVQYDF